MKLRGHHPDMRIFPFFDKDEAFEFLKLHPQTQLRIPLTWFTCNGKDLGIAKLYCIRPIQSITESPIILKQITNNIYKQLLKNNRNLYRHNKGNKNIKFAT